MRVIHVVKPLAAGLPTTRRTYSGLELRQYGIGQVDPRRDAGGDSLPALDTAAHALYEQNLPTIGRLITCDYNELLTYLALDSLQWLDGGRC